MGYSIEFKGQFQLNRPLSEVHRAYLEKFGETRRMKRDVTKLATVPDPIREAVGLPIGPEGAFFVGSTAPSGQDFDHPSVIDCNNPPEGQPSLRCHWTPDSSGTCIGCWEVRKFYHCVEWLEYLIAHFIAPWGYILNGEVICTGEDERDLGLIRVEDNQIEVIEPETDEEAYTLSSEEIERIVALFRSRNPEGIREAGSLAEYYNQPIPGAAEALLAHFDDPIMEVRWSAIEEWSALEAAAEPAIPLLIKALNDSHEWVRSAAAAALGAIGPSAAQAIPALERLLNDSSYGPRGRSQEALEQIRGGQTD